MITTPTVADQGVTVITADNVPAQAVVDLISGFKRHEVWLTFAVHDIRQRFRRSLIGPFWITMTMGIMVGALGLVFSAVFQQNIQTLLPYIATGIILWGLLTSAVTDGTTVFSSSESYIRNVPMPLSVHFYRLMARNLIIWFFNMAIYVIVVIFFPINWGATVFLALPGFILLVLNAAWLSLAAGILSARYRDIPQVITNVIQVVFFLTPVFWTTTNLPNRPHFVDWNPFYHMLEVVREPLLGNAPSPLSWLVSIGLVVVGGAVTVLLYRRAFSRIPYWI